MKQFNETEYNSYWSAILKLIDYNENITGIIEKFSLPEKLKNCAGALEEESGVAYPGGLVKHILGTIMYAKGIAGILSKHFSNYESLYKVLLLMHISKNEMFMKNPDEYQVNKFGRNYIFSETEGKLKAGLRSLLWCANNGIPLTPTEAEAMTVLDRDQSQGGNQYSRYESLLATIVRQANELAFSIEKTK